MLYVDIVKDLKEVSNNNRLFICADDATILVPSDLNIGLEDEFENVKQWAKDNRMILNFLITKEIVFERCNPRLFLCPSPIDY